MRRLLREHAVPIALAVVLLALLGPQLLCMHYVADDVPAVATYSSVDPQGALHPRWSRVAADFVGPWAGNPHIGFYRPVVSLSLALDFWLFGASPAGHALLNLALHLLSTFLVWGLARRLLPDPRSAPLAAALFACTPLAHENLAWMVGRCALCVAPVLAAGLVFVRRYDRGHRGRALQLPVLGLLAVGLLAMESALPWTLFPGLCLALGGLFRRLDVEERGGAFIALVVPHLALGLLYLVLRMVLVGPPAQAHLDLVLPSGILGWPLAALDRLVESIVPYDASFIHEPGLARAFRLLCIVPLLLGLFAPLHLRDPRSWRYRRALYGLLGFFVLTRLPTLGFGLGPALDSARAAYYAWPTLCLLAALLLATNRYSRWAGFGIALVFLAGLWHRTGARVHSAELGDRARALLVDEQRRRTEALCYVNQVNGEWGAPAIQPGEMCYALLPPQSPWVRPAFSMFGLAARQEWSTIAAFGEALGGVTLVRAPAPGGDLPIVEQLPLRGVPIDRPASIPARPRLVRGDDGWTVRLDPTGEVAATDPPGKPVLVLVVGPHDLVVDYEPGAPLPAEAQAALDRWRELAGDRAWVALLCERRRRRPAPPADWEVVGRSEVAVQQVGG